MDNQIVLCRGQKNTILLLRNVYGEDVETLVMDGDEQTSEQPIIKPVRNIKSEVIKSVTMSPLIT
ncbi:LOW QUALITY PROTEIN: 116 kDa U5 small nuclear ribonucleoprotein component, N-terminal [Parasponia andersonii]|uniref:116 kDa U5 small nuclear ribonucleoprotein component, N-terminal n=1 Tax=Parasponia andersonii TaxID=3476 RepID=A0A2P5AHE2_PARAD|nr:LOW QUALITY PROTEIN: 116 kDa U5 small nuclear ribonucleoprotein component, N-terminal [Parasponia andersonii]